MANAVLTPNKMDKIIEMPMEQFIVSRGDGTLIRY